MPWAWMSEELPKANMMKEITYRMSFDQIVRIRRLDVTYMITPQKYKFEVT